MKKTIQKRNKRSNRNARQYRLQGDGYTAFESPRVTFIDPHRYVALHYSQTFTSSMLTTAGAQQIMNLNSLFDPDRTGTGTQPYGFDQLAALYNRYRVLRCHWKVSFGTSSGTYFVVVVPVNGLVNSAIADAATFSLACQLPFAKDGIQGGGGSPSVKIAYNISLNELTGVTKIEYLADDRFEAQVSASPAELMTLYVGTYNPTTSTVIAFLTVDMIFDVDFHDPISQGAS